MTSQMPPPRWQPTNFKIAVAFEDAADDQPGDAQAFVERPADARRQTVVAHALFAVTDRRRMHHHRDAEARDQFKKWLGFIVVGVGVLMARIDQHAVQAVLSDGAFEFFVKRLRRRRAACW